MQNLIVGTIVTLATVAIACGGSSTAAPAGATPSAASPTAAAAASPTCKEIHEACEPWEHKGGAAQACHEMGHGSTEAQCMAKKTECAAACKK